MSFTPALAVPETSAAFRRRRRVIYVRLGIAVFVIFAGRWTKASYPYDAGLATGAMLIGIGFAFWVVTMWSHLGSLHVEWCLRRNPWVECSAKTGVLRAGPMVGQQVVVLTRDEWPEPVIRTVHPRHAAARLLAAKPDRLWAAGNPKRALVVSTVGGAACLHATRTPSRFLLRPLAALADAL